MASGFERSRMIVILSLDFTATALFESVTDADGAIRLETAKKQTALVQLSDISEEES